MQVTDLGAVLHMVGGTAASYMIFFLPGMLLLNAAIVKKTASMADLQGAEVSPPLWTCWLSSPKSLCPAVVHVLIMHGQECTGTGEVTVLSA